MRCFVFLAFLAGCCPGPDSPPPIFVPETAAADEPTAGSESPPPADPARTGIDEGGALNIAMAIAEQQGYDPALYTDVVVNSDGDHWVVQMRRPRVLRFFEVFVNKADGTAQYQVRSSR